MKAESIIVFMGGLILTMAGVGGIEGSVEDWDLALSVFVAVLGLAMFWCGIRMFQISNLTKEQ
jgi:hypothetical protein